MHFSFWIDSVECARQGIYSTDPFEHHAMTNRILVEAVANLAKKRGWTWGMDTDSDHFLWLKDGLERMVMKVFHIVHPNGFLSVNVETLWHSFPFSFDDAHRQIQDDFHTFCNQIVQSLSVLLTGNIFTWVGTPNQMHTCYLFNERAGSVEKTLSQVL